MKVKQIVEVRYSSSYCFSNLNVWDVDGTEVTIEMTKDQWLDLEDKVKSKCNSIREKRQGELDEIVEQRVAAQLEKEQADA